MAAHKEYADQVVSLFRLYEQKMYHIAFSILHDNYQAEDAVMEVFVRLLKGNYSIGDPSSNETKKLMILLTRSTAIDQYRKNQREHAWQTLTEEPTDLRVVQSEQPLLSFRPGVEAMIEELPDIYRDVLYLRYAREFSTSEIATALKISEDAVRKREERALRMLRTNKAKKGDLCYGTIL